METPDTTLHLFWGYSAIWLGLAVYLFLGGLELRKQKAKLEELAQNIQGLKANTKPGSFSAENQK